jgi:hypothetical protein
MQAEWEEMARRNWISENQEAQNQVTISASEKVTNSVLNMLTGFLSPFRSYFMDELITVSLKT